MSRSIDSEKLGNKRALEFPSQVISSVFPQTDAGDPEELLYLSRQ